MSVKETRKEPSPVKKCFCSLHAITHADAHTQADTHTHLYIYSNVTIPMCADRHTPACYSLAQMGKTCKNTHTHTNLHAHRGLTYRCRNTRTQ